MTIRATDRLRGTSTGRGSKRANATTSLVLASVLVVAGLAACSHDAGPRLVSRPAEASRSLVIRNVRIFDAPTGVMLEGTRDVVVRDGRIASIEPAAGEGGGQGRVVDARGGTLLPGLVDMHTHTASTAGPPWNLKGLPDVEDNLAAYLYAGTTTVLDLGSLTPAVFRERERVHSGEHLGPHFYAAGPVFTAPGGHPAEVLRAWLPWYLRWYVLPRATREVATPDEARSAVAALADHRPDIVKITIDAEATGIPRLAPETIAAITSAAHEAGMRAIAHIGSAAEAVDAVKSGVDALAHSPWRDELSDADIAVIANAHVPVVATLAVWDLSEKPRAGESDFLPMEREVGSSEVIAALLAPAPAVDHYTAAFLQAANAAHDARRRNVAKLRAAGVTILVGSDACNFNNFPGAGMHVELAKLVEAGFTPAEALRAATWENSRFLAGDDAEFGEVAVGKRADLVIVDGDPTARIADLQKITYVVLDGTVLERKRRAP
jgi:imidazolonepropionase-like amidohydrolase